MCVCMYVRVCVRARVLCVCFDFCFLLLLFLSIVRLNFIDSLINFDGNSKQLLEGKISAESGYYQTS